MSHTFSNTDQADDSEANEQFAAEYSRDGEDDDDPDSGMFPTSPSYTLHNIAVQRSPKQNSNLSAKKFTIQAVLHSTSGYKNY